jgi:hypothetical protein
MALSASTASRPAFVTTAKRPSVERDGDGYTSDLGKARSGIFLQPGLDRFLPDGQISALVPASRFLFFLFDDLFQRIGDEFFVGEQKAPQTDWRSAQTSDKFRKINLLADAASRPASLLRSASGFRLLRQNVPRPSSRSAGRRVRRHRPEFIRLRFLESLCA